MIHNHVYTFLAIILEYLKSYVLIYFNVLLNTQYQIVRPGFGVGMFVFNDFPRNLWTFFLLGLTDGRTPRQLSTDDMIEVLRRFLGPLIDFKVVLDGPWFWNLFFCRRFTYNRVILAGDAGHSWPPFGGLGGNTGYGNTVLYSALIHICSVLLYV